MLIRNTALWLPAGAGAPGIVTLDAFARAIQSSSADPWSALSLTLGATANYILVAVNWEQNVAIDGVTAGGEAMTPVTRVQQSTSVSTQLFWLDASGDFPEPGSISIVVDPNSSMNGVVGAWSLIGAANGAPSRTNSATATLGSNAAPTLAAVPAGAFVAGSCCRSASTISVTGEETEHQIDQNVTDSNLSSGYASNTPETEESVTHTWAGSANAAAIMAEILPS